MHLSYDLRKDPSSSDESHLQNPPKASEIQFVHDGYNLQKVSIRSRKGCLNCKIRKKKCNEARPICSDCKRLAKECIWIDPNMNEQTVKDLRERVRIEESTQKLRKRKPKTPSSTNSNPITISTGSNINNNAFIDNQAAFISENQIEQQSKISKPKLKSKPVGTIKPMNHKIPNTILNGKPENQNIFHIQNQLHASNVNNQIHVSNVNTHNNPSIVNPGSIPLGLTSDSKNNMATPADETNIFNYPSAASHFSHGGLSPKPDNDALFKDNTLFETQSNVSQSLFLNFFKDMSQYQSQHSPTQDNETSTSVKSRFELLDDNENDSENENDAFQSLENSISPPSPHIHQSLISFTNEAYVPEIHINPSLLPGLSGVDFQLYNYYVDTLSRKISIAPVSQNESNSYQQVFLPLAHQDKGVLYGILAWACFHLGGDWELRGAMYVDMALDHISNGLKKLKGEHDDRQSSILKLSTLLILCGAEICRGDVKKWSVFLKWGWNILSKNGGILKFNQSREENWLISNFAYHDLLASSNSNRGTYFPSEHYDKVFEDVTRFSKGKLNPLLGISKDLFKIIGDVGSLVFESKKIVEQYYNSDPLVENTHKNISKSPEPVFFDDILDSESHISIHEKKSKLLRSVLEQANVLEKRIDSAKPERRDLENLTDEELELQLTLFETFQITAKLFIRQAVLKTNPSALTSQILFNDLIKCIDITIGSSVQASLVFPVFIAGIHCVTANDKNFMRERIQMFIDSYGETNVTRVRYLIEKLWERNPNGDQVIDWYKLLEELDWEINFA